MANSVDPDQIAPVGAGCSGSTLFASVFNSSVMLGNYLQLTIFSDDFFFLGALRVKTKLCLFVCLLVLFVCCFTSQVNSYGH